MHNTEMYLKEGYISKHNIFYISINQFYCINIALDIINPITTH